MFIAKRASSFTEQIHLGNEVIDVEFKPTDIAIEFNNKYSLLIGANQKIKDLKIKGAEVDISRVQQVLSAFEDSVMALFQIVFGVEDTSKMLAFYQGNYIEMSQYIMPFITETVYPVMLEGLKDVRADIASKAKLNRDQRRFLARK